MRATAQRAPFNAQPLVLLAAAFAVGVLSSRAYTHALYWPVIGGALCGAVTLGACAGRRFSAATLLLLASFFCAGLSLALVEQRGDGGAAQLRRLYEDGRLASGEPLELTGVLTRAPETAPDGLYLALRVERIRRGQDETQ